MQNDTQQDPSTDTIGSVAGLGFTGVVEQTNAYYGDKQIVLDEGTLIADITPCDECYVYARVTSPGSLEGVWVYIPIGTVFCALTC